MTNSTEIKNALYLIIFAALLYGIHVLIARAFPICGCEDLINTHIFMLTLTLLTIFLTKIIFNKLKLTLLAYAFLFTGLLKMALSVLYLYPTIKEQPANLRSYVIQFFVIYFAYLIVEVIFMTKQISAQDAEKQKSKEQKQENEKQNNKTLV